MKINYTLYAVWRFKWYITAYNEKYTSSKICYPSSTNSRTELKISRTNPAEEINIYLNYGLPVKKGDIVSIDYYWTRNQPNYYINLFMQEQGKGLVTLRYDLDGYSAGPINVKHTISEDTTGFGIRLNKNGNIANYGVELYISNITLNGQKIL